MWTLWCFFFMDGGTTGIYTLHIVGSVRCVYGTAPEGVAAFEGVAAAGCQFWDIAAKGPVVTSTPDHELCAIGVHTLQMASPSDTCTQEIGDVLSVLSDLGYVRESDVARIPVMPRPSTHVIYAPLSNAPLPPSSRAISSSRVIALPSSAKIPFSSAGMFCKFAMSEPSAKVRPVDLNAA